MVFVFYILDFTYDLNYFYYMLLYILNEKDTWSYKIGHTKSKNANHRVKQLQTGCKNKIEIVWEMGHDKANMIEKMLHRSYSWCKQEGEWFLFEDINIEDVKILAKQFVENLKHLENNYFINK